MLKRLEVKHFKSLDDFSIDFEPLTVLIGQNGSGKTTVLQALDLMGAFLRGDVNYYLERQGWDAADLVSMVTIVEHLELALEFLVEEELFRWEVLFDTVDGELLVTRECLSSKVSQFRFEINFLFGDESFFLETKQGNHTNFPRPGIRFKSSILNSFLVEDAPSEIESISNSLKRIFLLDVHSVELLRKVTKYKVVDNVGNKGEQLASFIHSHFDNVQKDNLSQTVRRFVPQLSEVRTINYGGTAWITFIENFRLSKDYFQQVEINASHISDGTLQILALVATILGGEPGQILLLDEIENGIDPNHVAILVELLEEAIEKRGIQVILATHSPLIVNFAPESGIRYFSRESNGNVVAKKLFDRKELKKMLEYMGPGEVWMNLSEKDLVGEE